MPSYKEQNIYRTFIISTSLVVALALSGIFIDMAIRTRQLINEENIIQARIVFNYILLARKWNANYGGVYVEKKKGVEANPYLKDPDITTTDGRVFTLRNPALMTREISEYAENEGLFKFHITSLKLINPRNKPDAFEENALHRFETEAITEVYRTELVNDRTYFRYMAPLYIETACLQCHTRQNYAVGDVRGGISITFGIDDLLHKLRFKTISIVLFGILATLLLLGLIYYFMARLIRKLVQARETIEKIAITDELTGLYNRRYLLSRFTEEFEKAGRSGSALGCIIADIDHFKAINDRQGHLAGDEALREVSLRLKQSVRVYDIVGRYGGEEFLILLPDTNFEQAGNFAERTRELVRERPIRGNQITISMGVTCLHRGDRSIDDMIRRADEALYLAKHNGRDRVESVAGP